MLIEFTVGNCLSFEEPQTFSMVAANLPGHELEETHVIGAEGLRLLRSAALYGANASGKSNLATALGFFVFMSRNSATRLQDGDEIDVDAFGMRHGNEKRPSHFEMVLLVDGRKVRYGFEVTRRRVTAEWLFSQTSSRQTRLFTRENNIIDVNGKNFKEGLDKVDKVRDNALFLPVVAQWNGPFAKKMVKRLSQFRIISGLRDQGYAAYTASCLLNEHKNSTRILEFLRRLDLSFEDVRVKEVEPSVEPLESNTSSVQLEDERKKNKKLSVQLMHPIYDVAGRQIGQKAIDLTTGASEGTRKLFGLAGPLINVLESGMILYIDEMDARLHPLITRSIVQLFNSRETNPHNAQLIFNTHDTNLLTPRLLRRDQIWFAEKNRYHATHLYSLAEFRLDDGSIARKEANFEDQYVQGRYGGVPFLGDFAALFSDSEAENTGEPVYESEVLTHG